jgi:magnesium-protoporphyrin IX monomethyl ester (oxidative) cyclase
LEDQRPDGQDLDGLPYPTFDDYFAQLRTTSFAKRVLPALVMETSRGCWWGAKHHCTFCGLNAEGMAFRSKSAHGPARR